METQKKYYTISEVAVEFDVAPSLIRFWEGQFREIKPKKNRNGARQYTKLDIEVIGKIYHLVKKRGYTLQGAKKMLKNKAQHLNSIETIHSLEKVKSFLCVLRELINKIESTEDSEEKHPKRTNLSKHINKYR